MRFRFRSWLFLALIVLQGCAGTPVAEQLEESFDTDRTDPSAVSDAPKVAQSAAPVARTTAKPTEQTNNQTTEQTTDQTKSVAIDTRSAINAEPQKTEPPKTEPPKTEPQSDSSSAVKVEPTQHSTLPTKVQSLSSQAAVPYRIIIRLAASDPSAPAEAVTNALRRADVAFSVERIERLEGDPASLPPTKP